MNAIYCITNRVNGKMYIGKSVHVETRIKQHFNPASHCFGLVRAIKKHGKENFSWEVLLDGVPDDMASDVESFFIWQFRTLGPTGYNLTGGGEGFDKEAIRLRSENVEWRRKMAERNKKMAKDPQWIARNKEQSTDHEWKKNQRDGVARRSEASTWIPRMIEGARKRASDPEWKKKNLDANRRKAQDPEWLRRTREASNKRGKPVFCIDTGIVYFSIREAQRQTGVSDVGIIGVCKGKPKHHSAGGFRWRYATQEESVSARRDILHR